MARGRCRKALPWVAPFATHLCRENGDPLLPYVGVKNRCTLLLTASLSDNLGKPFGKGKAASSPCLRPGSTLALRGRGFNPALDQGDAHAPLEPQHKVPRPNGRGLNG